MENLGNVAIAGSVYLAKLVRLVAFCASGLAVDRAALGDGADRVAPHEGQEDVLRGQPLRRCDGVEAAVLDEAVLLARGAEHGVRRRIHQSGNRVLDGRQEGLGRPQAHFYK